MAHSDTHIPLHSPSVCAAPGVPAIARATSSLLDATTRKADAAWLLKTAPATLKGGRATPTAPRRPRLRGRVEGDETHLFFFLSFSTRRVCLCAAGGACLPQRLLCVHKCPPSWFIKTPSSPFFSFLLPGACVREWWSTSPPHRPPPVSLFLCPLLSILSPSSQVLVHWLLQSTHSRFAY